MVWGEQALDIRNFDQPFTSVSAGHSFNLGLRADGTVVAWGHNFNGQCIIPAGLAGVSAIAAGSAHSVALKTDGTVAAWGNFTYGQINIPVGLTGVTAIAAGSFHTAALKSNGTVVAWGQNNLGQTSVPAGLTGVTAIACGGNHTVALKMDGTVVAWGQNNQGQTTVPSGLTDVVAIAAGDSFTCAVKSDGTVVAWGSNSYGQTTVPPGLTEVTRIAAGANHTVSLKADGTVIAWGRNEWGQTDVPAGLAGVTAISCNGQHTIALKSDGSHVCWGGNVYGQSNVASDLSNIKSIAVGQTHLLGLKRDGQVITWGTNLEGQTTLPAGLSGVTAIDTGYRHSIALKSNGAVVAWGRNLEGQTTIPISVSNATTTAIAAGSYHSVALLANGTVVSWGAQSTVPVGLSGVTAIAAGGSHTVALKSNGTVVAWGSNSNGQTNVPADLTGVTAITAGDFHTVALKTDGSIVAWGRNIEGQTTIPPGLSNVISIAAGTFHTVALKADGSIISWGSNESRQSTVPEGLSAVTAIAAGYNHTFALREDTQFAVFKTTSMGPEVCENGTTHDFGSITTSSGNVIRTFTIENTGAANLMLSPMVISGPHAADFTVTQVPASPVIPTASTTFQVTFDPSLHGLRTATLTFSSNDPDDSPFSLILSGTGNSPVIEVLGNGQAIVSGDSTPHSSDGSDFGAVELVNALATQTFTIVNSGNLNLQLQSFPRVTITGPHSNDFELTVQPASTVPVGGSTSFAITFNPSQTGHRTAEVRIGNNDTARNPFTFSIQGTGTKALMSVTGNGQVILNGDSTPSATDGSDMGSVSLINGQSTQIFTISNNGDAQLTLTGTPRVAVTGSHSADFVVTTIAENTVVVGGTTSFAITFNPSQIGLRSAEVSIANNDPERNPFTFSIQGTGISATMEVAGNGQAMIDGDTTPDGADGSDFGTVSLLNTQVTRLFTISNSGDVALNLTGTPAVEIMGDHAAEFEVTTLPAASVAVGESTPLAISFDPNLPGLRTAVVSIANDDPERDPFTFAVSGFGGLSKLLPQSIAFTAPGTMYQGEGPVALVAEASSGLPVALEVVSGPGTLAGSVLTPTGVGRVTVRATQAGGGNYAAAKAVTRVITVKADPSVLTLTGLSQRYDGAPKTVGTVGAAGLVAVSYQVGGVFGDTAPTAAGRYAVRAVADGVTKTGTLVIAKAPLYVVPEDRRKFAGEINPPLSLGYEGFIGGDDESVLTRVPVLATTAKTTSPGGTYPITAKGGAAANYVLVYRQGTLVVESFAAGYEALLVDAVDVPSGKLSLTVAKSGRSFSGSMALAGETTALRVSGPLVTNSSMELATGEATVLRNGMTYDLDFSLPMHGRMTGAVQQDGLDLATVDEGRRLLVLAKGGKVNYSGAHTVVLEPATPAGAGVPAGAGWARATINTRGAIALAGKLGDGTAFTTSLLPDAEETPGYRLWMQPYKPSRANTFLGGAFSLKQHPLLSRGFVADWASLAWAKAERAADNSYPAGFVPVAVGIKLDPWIKPSATQPLAALLGLSGDSIEVAHSTTGSASDADLPTTVTLSTRNAVSVPGGSNPTKWKTQLNTANGTFTGSFELLDAGVRRVAPFSGVLRQPVDASDAVVGDGHFIIPATPGSAETAAGEVLFTRP